MRLVTQKLTVLTPTNFNFWRTAYSHGWCDLPPFDFDIEKKELNRLFMLDDGALADCTMTGADHSIRIVTRSNGRLSVVQRASVLRQVGTCLRLDEDLSEFHRIARRHPQYRWMATTGTGRMLRAPTVFEDVVKMICTTNCTWALTKLMVTNLVQLLGNKFDNSTQSFPSPDVIAGTTEKQLRSEIKAGYRSPYLLELAERVAAKKLDLEAWRNSPLPTDELFKEMRCVKGIGPYAAGNLLKLVGRYDHLGLDSWVRSRYYTLDKKGRKVKDATIERQYTPFGKWRGIFFWFEMTRYWHDEKFRF
jgi:N-glycosylase/DNA lyase